MHTLLELLSVPRTERGSEWRDQIYRAVLETPFVKGERFDGPDDFPYLQLRLPSNLDESTALIADLIDEAIAQGSGIAIHDATGAILWVFSHGDLVSFQRFGVFEQHTSGHTAQNADTVVTPPSTIHGNPVSLEQRTVTEERTILTGAPSEDFFPSSERAIVRDYLIQHGINNPKCMLLVDPTLEPTHALVFSVFPEDFQDEQTFQVFMERLSWFFPSPFSIIAMPKEQALAHSDSFAAL